jgi:putative NADPH-quinone reductase
MKRNILVINGHPDPAPARLSAALASAYAAGAAYDGHSVARIDVGAQEFPFLRHNGDFLTMPDNPDILAARAEFMQADHLVFVYPLWLGGPPAMLKAFLEQVSRAEFALKAGAGGLPKGQLKGKSARVIVTMGMPAIAYRLIYQAHGVKALNRSMLGIAGVWPIRTSYFGAIGYQKNCDHALEAVTALGRATA